MLWQNRRVQGIEYVKIDLTKSPQIRECESQSSMSKQAQWLGKETGKEDNEEAWRMLECGYLIQNKRRSGC